MENRRFLRTEVLLGHEGMERLRGARVMVVGLGAVGGYALEALARAGVGHLTLVISTSLTKATSIARSWR